MFMQLVRFETAWDYVMDFRYVDQALLQEDMAKAFVHQNRFDHSLALSSFIGVKLEDIPWKYQQLKSMLKARCKSMKFYFQSEDQKVLPQIDLEALGFNKQSPQIWVHDHPDYSVSAIAITSFKECEWILQVGKRKGRGLPDHAADFAMLFDRQMKLDLNEVVKVS
jgi:hypothetical protein